jgi:hypothetical protein
MVLVVGAAALGACVEDRPRPGPPALRIVLDQLSVTSPDTLTGTVIATDRDGIDSIWLTVDTIRVGEEGFFQAEFNSLFSFAIASGKAPGTVIPVRFEARDVGGFVAILDTTVNVVP